MERPLVGLLPNPPALPKRTWLGQVDGRAGSQGHGQRDPLELDDPLGRAQSDQPLTTASPGTFAEVGSPGMEI